MNNKSIITRNDKLRLVIAGVLSNCSVCYKGILKKVNNPHLHLLVKLKQFDFTNKCIWGFFVSIKKEEIV